MPWCWTTPDSVRCKVMENAEFNFCDSNYPWFVIATVAIRHRSRRFVQLQAKTSFACRFPCNELTLPFASGPFEHVLLLWRAKFSRCCRAGRLHHHFAVSQCKIRVAKQTHFYFLLTLWEWVWCSAHSTNTHTTETVKRKNEINFHRVKLLWSVAMQPKQGALWEELLTIFVPEHFIFVHFSHGLYVHFDTAHRCRFISWSQHSHSATGTHSIDTEFYTHITASYTHTPRNWKKKKWLRFVWFELFGTCSSNKLNV